MTERGTLTAADWAEIEKQLGHLYHPVILKIDGYLVTLQLERIGKLRLAIVVWVNGAFKGEWISKDCEERRRFYRSRKRSLLTGRRRAAFVKDVGKRYASKSKLLTETFVYYEFYWASFAALKRHLVRNNQSIEWVRDEQRATA